MSPTPNPTTVAPADDARLAEIRKRVDAALPKAPEQVKAALTMMISKRSPSADTTVTAGRIGAQLGNISELTVLAPLKPGGAQHLRGLFSLLQGNFEGAKQVG